MRGQHPCEGRYLPASRIGHNRCTHRRRAAYRLQQVARCCRDGSGPDGPVKHAPNTHSRDGQMNPLSPATRLNAVGGSWRRCADPPYCSSRARFDAGQHARLRGWGGAYHRPVRNLHIACATATWGELDLYKGLVGWGFDGAECPVPISRTHCQSPLHATRHVEKLPRIRVKSCTDEKPTRSSVLLVRPVDWLPGGLRDWILCAAGAPRRFPETDVARRRSRPAVCPPLGRSPSGTSPMRREVS